MKPTEYGARTSPAAHVLIDRTRAGVARVGKDDDVCCLLPPGRGALNLHTMTRDLHPDARRRCWSPVHIDQEKEERSGPCTVALLDLTTLPASSHSDRCSCIPSKLSRSSGAGWLGVDVPPAHLTRPAFHTAQNASRLPLDARLQANTSSNSQGGCDGRHIIWGSSSETLAVANRRSGEVRSDGRRGARSRESKPWYVFGEDLLHRCVFQYGTRDAMQNVGVSTVYGTHTSCYFRCVRQSSRGHARVPAIRSPASTPNHRLEMDASSIGICIRCASRARDGRG
ncbi:hypothetical protein C8Q80DRAFT_437400 [Daedaleopsis nitida]|nr:hypothetical protein C8Q80DRAFT_437400 [Daedaleopsis nitida]